MTSPTDKPHAPTLRAVMHAAWPMQADPAFTWSVFADRLEKMLRDTELDRAHLSAPGQGERRDGAITCDRCDTAIADGGAIVYDKEQRTLVHRNCGGLLVRKIPVEAPPTTGARGEDGVEGQRAGAAEGNSVGVAASASACVIPAESVPAPSHSIPAGGLREP